MAKGNQQNPTILVKIHQVYREVVAVCDSELVGKRFEQGNKQLDINEDFFKGQACDEAQAINLIKEKLADDACFNFVGKYAIQAGIKAGAIDKNGVMKVQGVPYAFALL